MSLNLASKLSLPLEAITETIAILGIRGSGKTNTCVVLTEELLDAGQQVVVIDPTDVWWGLKSSKDGAHAGYPVVVFGGRHGDVPLSAGDGNTVADFVVEERLPAILSLRHFESQADQRRFVTDFARRLYHRKGEENRDTPMLLAIDEAHLFVPQRVGGAEAQMVGAIQKLVRQGRSSGIGVAVIDQRAASVNKDILTQLELLICHRTTSPQDRDALEGWIEQHDTADQKGTFLKRLAELGRGVAWCWSPGWLDIFKEVPIRERRTFDSSATPKAGEKRITPTTLAKVDLDALKAKMGAAIEKAEADDPKKLRARIAELEREVKRASIAVPVRVETKVERVEVPVMGEHELSELLQLVDRFVSLRDELGDVVHKANERMDVIREKLVFWRNIGIKTSEGHREVCSPSRPELKQQSSRRAESPKSAAPQGSNGAIGGGERKILNALAQHPEGLTRAAVAMMAGYAKSGGTFGTYLSRLRTNGYIDGTTDLVITDAGEKALGSFEPLPTGKDLRLYWERELGSYAQKLLGELADVHPRALHRDALAARTGYEPKGGTYGTYLSRLRTLGLIVGSRDIKLAPELVS